MHSYSTPVASKRFQLYRSCFFFLLFQVSLFFSLLITKQRGQMTKRQKQSTERQTSWYKSNEWEGERNKVKERLVRFLMIYMCMYGMGKNLFDKAKQRKKQQVMRWPLSLKRNWKHNPSHVLPLPSFSLYPNQESQNTQLPPKRQCLAAAIAPITYPDLSSSNGPFHSTQLACLSQTARNQTLQIIPRKTLNQTSKQLPNTSTPNYPFNSNPTKNPPTHFGNFSLTRKIQPSLDVQFQTCPHYSKSDQYVKQERERIYMYMISIKI